MINKKYVHEPLLLILLCGVYSMSGCSNEESSVGKASVKMSLSSGGGSEQYLCELSGTTTAPPDDVAADLVRSIVRDCVYKFGEEQKPRATDEHEKTAPDGDAGDGLPKTPAGDDEFVMLEVEEAATAEGEPVEDPQGLESGELFRWFRQDFRGASCRPAENAPLDRSADVARYVTQCVASFAGSEQN